MRVGEGTQAGVAAYPMASPAGVPQHVVQAQPYQQYGQSPQVQAAAQAPQQYYVQPPSANVEQGRAGGPLPAAATQHQERNFPAMSIEDDICAMGFARDQVRATIVDLARRNPGAALDLNTVLDTLQRAPERAPAARW